MNRQLAEILLSKIDAPYIDRKAGLVQAFEKAYEIDNGNGQSSSIIKKIPMAFVGNKLVEFIPNSKYRCMVYFEDYGISSPTNNSRGWYYESRIRLICWMNTVLFSGVQDPAVVVKVMNDIVSRLSGINPFNQSPYTMIQTKVINIPIQDKNIFSRYTYTEADLQYLMAPYDFFALDLRVSFTIPRGCLPTITTTAPTSC